MEKRVVIIPENLTLFRIKVAESNIQSEKSPIEKLNFRINVGHNIMHNLTDERVKIGLIVDIIGEKDKKESGTKAHFNIEFHFHVKDLKNFYNLDESKNPVFEGLLIATLIGIAFSTARGLIYERLNKTPMAGIILPIVSPQKMLTPPTNPQPPKVREK